MRRAAFLDPVMRGPGPAGGAHPVHVMSARLEDEGIQGLRRPG
jgi:hypothetical protein